MTRPKVSNDRPACLVCGKRAAMDLGMAGRAFFCSFRCAGSYAAAAAERDGWDWCPAHRCWADADGCPKCVAALEQAFRRRRD